MAFRGQKKDGRVWDPLVRLFHWSLVAAFTTAWLGNNAPWLHEGAGKSVLVLIIARTAWGIIGPSSARFSAFVCGPREVARYLLSILLWRPKRHLGHNPAGAAMIVALLAALGVTAVSGAIMSTTLLWGSAVLGTVHSLAAYTTLTLVVGHILGVLLASLQHRENLVRAMITGRKQVPPQTAPYLGRMDIRLRSIGRAAMVVIIAAAGWLTVTTSLDASLWRMDKILAAELMKTRCRQARPVSLALQLYPHVALGYTISYGGFDGARSIRIGWRQALARRPAINHAELNSQCDEQLMLAAARVKSGDGLATASVAVPEQLIAANAKTDREDVGSDGRPHSKPIHGEMPGTPYR